MALTLAACGSDDDTAADDAAAGDSATDETTEETTDVAVALSALQAKAASILDDAVASDVAVEAAAIAAGSDASIMAQNEVTTAPTTVAASTALIDDSINLITAEMDSGAGLEANSIVTFATVLGGATYATWLTGLTAVTAAEKTALATTMSNINAALDFETATNAQTLTAAQNALMATAGTPTAAESAAIAGINGVSSLIATNALADAINEDTTTLTAAETTAGASAYAAALHAAILANNSTYAEEYAALTAVERAEIVDAIEAIIGAGLAIAPTTDANSGAVTAASGGSVAADLLAAAAEIDATETANSYGLTAVTDDATGVASTATVGTEDLAAAAIDTLANAQIDSIEDAALIAAFNNVLTLMEAAADAENGGELAQAMADLVATESLGEESIDLNGGAATDGDDVFVFGVSSGVAQTIGTAAAYLGETGTDTVIIQGDYTFVTITEAQNDAIATTAVGDQAAMEIFVYQDATTGNAILHVEENAFDGSLDANGAMTTVTLTDVTFADLTQIDVDGYTVLVAEAAVA
jgi:hypothetical protein